MSYQSKIDALTAKYRDIADETGRDYSGFAYIGVVWSFASALIGITQGIARLNDPESFMQARLSEAERRERITRLEQRKDEIGYAMAWANGNASSAPEFAISGADIVERLSQDTPVPPTDEQTLEMEATAFDIDIDTIRILDAADRAEQEVRREELRSFIESDREALAKTIDSWLNVEVDSQWELGDIDAARVARKLGDKATDHADKEFIRARRERSPSRKMNHAGHFRLFRDLSEQAEALRNTIQDDLDAQGPQMVDATTDHTASQESADVNQALTA